MSKHAAIIEREFRRVLRNNDASISVTFNDDETISVFVDGDVYEMIIGSDDDQFVFECDTASPVVFDIPDDYID